jgi:hypothetical protein
MTCSVDVKLAAPVAITRVEFDRTIDVNGQTLTIESADAVIPARIDGSGTIRVNGSNVSIRNSGSFSGTIIGSVDIDGSMPDATIAGGAFSGKGSFGNVTTTAGLSPGSLRPGITRAIATLQTRSISIGGTFHADVISGAPSDRLVVNGTVTLGDQLDAALLNNPPAQTEVVTIVENDGSDAIVGTFAGLAEGAQIAAPGAVMTISYRGGDGNDVTLTIVATGKSWTGANSTLWSDPGNWSPAGVPLSGESLLFPSGATRTDVTNDIPGLSVGPLTLKMNFTIHGQPLTLTGDIVASPGSVVFDADVKLASLIQLTGSVTFNGGVDVNGLTLTNFGTMTGAINGSGTVIANEISTTGGTFSGTLRGNVTIFGSMPDATVEGGSLTGIGTIGAVSTTGILSPGMPDALRIGTLRTRSISIGGPFYADLVTGAASDQLVVTGTVTLGHELFAPMLNEPPHGVEVITIIDNDGTDAIVGIFTGLPEGTQIPQPGAVMTISYHGGDGNDVTATLVATGKSWTRASSALWSDPANWNPVGVPLPDQPLLFPSSADPRTDITYDLPAYTTIGPITTKMNYLLRGNPVTLTHDAGGMTFQNDVKMGAPITGGIFNGAVDVNGQTLTNPQLNGAINGSGTIIADQLSIRKGGTFSGNLIGTFDLVGSMPNATVIGGGFSGDGTIGAVTTTGELHIGSPAGSSSHQITTLHTGSIDIGGPLFVDLISGARSDLLAVTGSVTLHGALLASLLNAPPLPQSFTIIDNDGTDPVIGTFENLPEGGFALQPPWKFRISYRGGDGNDVTLTPLADTLTLLAQDAASTKLGEPVTFRASVTAAETRADGTITFTDGGVFLGTVPLVNGIASLEWATLTAGTHTIAALYNGTDFFAASSASVSHVVSRGRSAASLSIPSATYGDGSELRVNVAAVAPAFGEPSGTVALRIDGVFVTSAPLVAGQAIFAPLVDAGAHAITASYSGDDAFEPSEAAGSLVVSTAATTIAAASSTGRAGNAKVVTLDIHVIAPQTTAVPVTGAVIVAEHGVQIAQQILAGGSAAITLELPPGEHRLTISYPGTQNFQPSSISLVLTVTPPQVSLHDINVFEGDIGDKIVQVPVTLSSRTADAVTVSWQTVDGTARSGDER